MKITPWLLPVGALACGLALTFQPRPAHAFSLLGGELDMSQRDFRIWNNFTAAGANDNQTPDASFPGATGAVVAIWKGVVEWQSSTHGAGNGDPHQPGGLGSGNANFDPSFQGLLGEAGGSNDNVHSQISGCNGGVLAFCEIPISDGWRIRYYECWDWSDGPGTNVSGFDLQSVACHEYGHALGLGHSGEGGSTMWPSVGSGDVNNRSIHADDRAGVQAIYGVANPNKPVITSTSVVGDTITINGSNLPATGGQAWFTKGVPGDGTPIKSVTSNSNGTTLTISPIPNNVGPGDVLVIANNVGGYANLSNAAPLDATGILCGEPTNYCVLTPNSVGAGVAISSSGSLEVSDAWLVLEAFGGPPGQSGIFFYGTQQVQVPFGDGVRCVGGGALGTFRFPVQQIDAFGDVAHEVDWDAPPVNAGGGAISGGTTWNFQFWYRDPSGGPAGFNLSDARTISFCP